MRSASNASKERTSRPPFQRSAGSGPAKASGEQRIPLRSARSRHEHRRSTLPSEQARLAAARCPDVEDPIADPAARVVDEEASVVLPTDVQLEVAAQREELRIRGDDPVANEVVAPGRSLEAVRRQVDGHRLAGAEWPRAADRPVPRRTTDERAVEPEGRGRRRGSRRRNLGGRRWTPNRCPPDRGRRPDTQQGDRSPDGEQRTAPLPPIAPLRALGSGARDHASTSCTS